MGPSLRKILSLGRVWDYLVGGWAGVVDHFSEAKPTYGSLLRKRCRRAFDLADLVLERRMMPSFNPVIDV